MLTDRPWMAEMNEAATLGKKGKNHSQIVPDLKVYLRLTKDLSIQELVDSQRFPGWL